MDKTTTTNRPQINDAAIISTEPVHSVILPGRFRRLTAGLGFTKLYNVSLFIILAGAMLAFCLARISCMDVSGQWAITAAPGEWYWHKKGRFRVGITLHLCTMIPAGILLVLQFVPAIRHRFILLHRIIGYAVITLVLIGNIGALMIARHTFGGDLSTQAGVGMLAILTTSSMALAYYNVKRFQIEGHRAWMLRTAAYLGTIITTRLIMIVAAQILSRIGSYYVVMTCGELLSMRDAQYVSDKYPTCAPGILDPTIDIASTTVSVHVQFGRNIEEIASSMRLPFGMSLWLAILLHAIAVEVYLALTPREATRLRIVSYQRQLEAGFKKPGSAGLVIEAFADADPWHVPDQLEAMTCNFTSRSTIKCRNGERSGRSLQD